jgi:hypothetical protein
VLLFNPDINSKSKKLIQLQKYMLKRSPLKLFIPGLLFIGTALTSCEFKNEENMEFVPCDTSNITYSSVRPIFENNCVRCHNDLTNYFDIKLSSYENAKAAAQSGYLIKAVNHLPGVVPMPFQLPMLDACDVKKITIWINNNTPQ